MLHESGPPKYLWAEAFSTATYVFNGAPTKALGGHSPYTVAARSKPAVAHLRAFGASCAVVGLMERLRKPALGRATCGPPLHSRQVLSIGISQSVGTRDVE